jgi:Zn-dependent protease with chaperone function
MAAALVLFTMSMCAVLCPLADAWVSRRNEYAADRFAAHCGAAAPLSAALTRMDSARSPVELDAASAEPAPECVAAGRGVGRLRGGREVDLIQRVAMALRVAGRNGLAHFIR